MDTRFSQAILDSLPASVAVLNSEGVIVAVNRSWRRFTEENLGQATGIGVNYLAVPRQATGPFSEEAQAASLGIRSVLDGSVPRFSLEYPCHSPTQHRWFQMEVTLVEDVEPPTVVVMHRDITERKLMEESLRTNEKRLRLALEAGGMGTWVWDIQANRSVWNEQEYNLLGLPPGDGPVDADVFFDLVHPDDLPDLNRVLSEAVLDGKEFKYLFRIVRPDGATRWLAGRGQMMHDVSSRNPRLMFGVNFDVTESKVAEESLRHAESLLRLVMNTNPNLIDVKDRECRFLMANQALADFYNVPLSEIVGHRQADIHRRMGCKNEELEKGLTWDRQVVETGFPIQTQVEVTDHCGTTRRHHTQKLPIELGGGQRAVLTVSTDITALHDSMMELRTRLRQQEAVADLGMFAFKTLHLDSLLQRCVESISTILDNEYCKILELQPDNQSSLLRAGVGWDEGLVGHAIVPADRGSQAGYTLLAGEPVIVTDLRTETRFSGPSLLFDHGVVSGMSVIIPGAARPFGVLGTHTRQRHVYSKDDVFFLQCIANIIADFIERMRMEARYRLLVESIEDYAIVVLNPTGIVTTWNSGAEKHTGCKAEEVIGQSFTRFFTPEDVAEGKPALELRKAAETGRAFHEGWRLRKDGSRFLARCHTFAIRCEWAKLVGFAWVGQDVTAVRREEASLRSVVDHSVDVIFTIDQHGTIQSCGGAVQKVFGYKCCELTGQNISILMSEPIRSEHDRYIANYLRTGVTKLIGTVREISGRRTDGSQVPLEIVITEFQLDGGRYFTGILAVIVVLARIRSGKQASWAVSRRVEAGRAGVRVAR